MLSKVIHCTSVHQWDDVRIFHKMARSLAGAGYDAHVVALDRRAAAERAFASDGVTVHLLPGADIGSRLARSVKGGHRVVSKARSLGGDIIHIHDPELIPFLFGGLRGKARIVFDAHEDLAGQIDSKPWVPRSARPLMRAAARLLKLAARRADGLVAATPHIAARLGSTAVAVQNFPLLDEFPDLLRSRAEKSADAGAAAIYAGGITRARGIVPMVEAVGLVDRIETLHLAGTFQPGEFRREVEALAAWSKVRFHGQLSRPALSELMASADIGLVTLFAHENYVHSQPTKLFEYLGAGLLVVASDFPAWRERLGPERLAEFVDPADPASIADGLRRVAALPAQERERRRSAGRAMIAGQTNWETEFRKLLGLYQQL